jgi:hypothetical protein
MTISPGSSLRNPSFRPIEGWASSLPAGLGICIAAGIAAGLADLYVRLPLHLPGWRGLIVMGLLIAARQLSGRAWAASFAGFAAACASLALAGPPRFTTLALLAPGIAIDALYLSFPRLSASALLAGLVAGLGNLVKFAVSFFAFAGFAHGDGAINATLMPWISHFGFGFCGGLIAVLLTKPWRSN